MAELDKLQATAYQRDTRQNSLRRQNKELEKLLADLQSSHQKELTMLTKRKDAKIASADQLRIYHQQEADTITRKAETALEKRDRAQETAAALQAQVQAVTERIQKLDDRIHHVTFNNKRLEAELQEARLEATRASTNPGNIVQMAMNLSGLQEKPAHTGESVGPLDHIIQGFKPSPLDCEATTEIATIQAQLEAPLAAREANETPAVSAPVASNEGVNEAAPIDALNTRAVHPVFNLYRLS